MANVLLGVTGGIAAFKSAQLVRLLRADGHVVRCALTRAASQFVSPLTLEVLSGNPVCQEEYLRPNGSGEELHVMTADWADIVCIAPATTHGIVRIANGLGDDFLTTTLLAYLGPLVIAPAMHSRMWERATTQTSIARLSERGVHVVGPDHGLLANGESGMGRMVEPEAIVDAVTLALGTGDYRSKRVVVTAGPTYEAIDPVRFIGNRSSGRMGFAIARAAALRGAHVSLIAGPSSLSTPSMVERVDVSSALDMQAALIEAVAETTPDLVVMCAAIADYRPAVACDAKIKRAGKNEIELQLVANPDLLLGLKDQAPSAVRVGFAAETENLEANAVAKLTAKGAHFLCANDVSRSDIGFDSVDNQLVVYADDGSRTEFSKAPKRELADGLLDLFHSRLPA